MWNFLKFSENLKELIAVEELNPPALAKILKTDRSNVTRYLNGEQIPSFKVFNAIITFFNVSADVMLGLKDYSSATKFIPTENFASRLRRVMQETDTTQYRLEKDLKLSGASVYNWLFDKSLPSLENLVKLAKYMDVSVDYLLGRIN